ncbi:MAG: hypothetical protein ABIR37_00390 [Candidatus Saccharimonadales bacterium]
MRIEELSPLFINNPQDGFRDFESVAASVAQRTKIQKRIDGVLANGRETFLHYNDPDNPGFDFDAYADRMRLLIRPIPMGENSAVAHACLGFGMYLAGLLTTTRPLTPETSMFDVPGKKDELGVLVNKAPLSYLKDRPHVTGLIQRNMISPIMDHESATIVTRVAGLAVMQCGQYVLDEYLRAEGAKLEDDISKLYTGEV